jgi:hypothetical protein
MYFWIMGTHRDIDPQVLRGSFSIAVNIPSAILKLMRRLEPETMGAM